MDLIDSHTPHTPWKSLLSKSSLRDTGGLGSSRELLPGLLNLFLFLKKNGEEVWEQGIMTSGLIEQLFC